MSNPRHYILFQNWNQHKPCFGAGLGSWSGSSRRMVSSSESDSGKYSKFWTSGPGTWEQELVNTGNKLKVVGYWI